MREQYDRQARFTDQYLGSKDRSVRLNRVELTKEYVLALHREVDEILDEVPWKGHRLYDETEPVKTNVGEEIADVIKYAMGLAHIWGFSYDELVAEIDVKSDVVDDRWRQEHGEPWGTGPIALIDLDGVLNYYPDPFLDWMAEQPKYKAFRGWSMERLEREAPETKSFAKHEYRQSGLKRHLPANAESVAAIKSLAVHGYEIVILSQRPAEQYHRIYGDTVYWLRTNEIPYRRLIFSAKKEHRLILSPILSRVAFAVDDDPDVVDRLRDLGVKTYWLVENAIGPAEATGGISTMLDIPEVIACRT